MPKKQPGQVEQGDSLRTNCRHRGFGERLVVQSAVREDENNLTAGETVKCVA